MAELIPDEGLDYWINVMIKGGTPPATTYAGIFTSATASTTPGASAVLATATGVTEAAYTGYLRQSIAAASWGTTGAKTIWTQSARGTTAAQVSFPAATATSSTALNGWFLASTSGTGTGIALCYSNWDDQTAVASLAIGDIVRLTPTFGLLG